MGIRAAGSLVLILCLICYAFTASAATMHREVENPELEIEAILGYDGMITYGKPIPVRVVIRNWGGDFEGSLGINAYVNKKQYDRYETSVALPGGAVKEIMLPVTVEAKQEVFTIELKRGDEVVRAVNLMPAKVVNPGSMLIGVLSTRPEQLKNLDIDRDNDSLMRYEYWQTVPLTADTFPEDERLMGAFGMLVIDDIDPGVLTDSQKQALDRWLRSGHIVLCGGGSRAAKNIAGFSSYTGLQATGVTMAAGVVPALEGLTNTPESGIDPKVTVADIRGGEAMAIDADGRGVLYRSDAGAGRIYTMSFEAGDPALNTLSLMHSFWQQLLVKTDNSSYNNCLYYRAEYNPAATTLNLPLQVNSPLLPAALTAAGGLVIGAVLYVILKKKDKRQWLWAALPAVALAAAGAVLALSGGSELSRPMMTASTGLIQEESGITRSYTGYLAAAPETGTHRYSTADGELNVEETDYYYYYEDENDSGKKIQEPTMLRTCRYSGAESAVGVSLDKPWEVKQLKLIREEDLGGKAEAAIWMEADGLHGEILNGTGCTLKEGIVLTSYGFVTIPALAPGQKESFSLVRAEGQDQQNAAWQNGKMYAMTSGALYSAISCATAAPADAKEDVEASARREAVNMLLNAVADQVRQDRQAAMKGSIAPDSVAEFLYVAEPEGYEAQALAIDGREILVRSGMTRLGVPMSYLPVGKTGVVFHAAGTLLPERCELDEKMMPDGIMKSGNNSQTYFNLNEIPTFRFTLADAGSIRMDHVCVTYESYYVNVMKAYVLNPGTGSWEEFQLNVDLPGAEQYFDREGQLYVQFRPVDPDQYNSIPAPALTIEGRKV